MPKRLKRKATSRRASHKKTGRRSARKAAPRKTARKKVAKKKVEVGNESTAHFRKTHWSVFRNLQKKADRAWAKLRADVKRKAPPEVLMEDRNSLLLLLGECHYMAGECMRTGMKRG